MDDYNHLVSRSFHLRWRILFSVQSPYFFLYRTFEIFRVGSWCLPSSCSIFKEQYSWSLESTFWSTPTWLSQSMVCLSRQLRINQLSCAQTLLHISLHFCIDSVCSFPLSIAFTNGITFVFFSSTYLDASIWWVPDPLRERDPKATRSRIRLSWVLRLLAPRPSLSQLARTFISLESQAIHQMVWRSDPFSCLYWFHNFKWLTWPSNFSSLAINRCSQFHCHINPSTLKYIGMCTNTTW